MNHVHRPTGGPSSKLNKRQVCTEFYLQGAMFLMVIPKVSVFVRFIPGELSYIAVLKLVEVLDSAR